MQRKSIHGLTLPELLITLTVFAILANLALPSFSSVLTGRSIESAVTKLDRSISLARSTAVSTGKTVTICRSRDSMTCSGSWHEGFIVFTDGNADSIVNQADLIVRVGSAVNNGAKVEFRAFQNKQYLQITALGFTKSQSGNFTFCPQNRDNRLAQQLIINGAGRTRWAQDHDHDGIREGASGKPLVCR